ncbi:MAG: ABC transporter permease subunit, partial [Nitriliruptoraceae bacterium]
ISWLSTQFWPLVAALVGLALPPIFTNTYTAVREVEGSVVEAARGMGYTEWAIVRRVELPLASPVIAAGIRLAYIQVVATTAIGAIVTSGGGLGRFIVDGFATGIAGRPAVVAGALLLAVVTLTVEGILALAQRVVIPVGVRNELSMATVASRSGAAG